MKTVLHLVSISVVHCLADEVLTDPATGGMHLAMAREKTMQQGAADPPEDYMAAAIYSNKNSIFNYYYSKIKKSK